MRFRNQAMTPIIGAQRRHQSWYDCRLQDRFKFTTIAHAHRSFLGPYSADSLLALESPGFVLDIGCGKGTTLQALGGVGIGIEFNPAFAAEARVRNPRAEIWEEDAAACLNRLPRSPDLIVCPGASQAIGTRDEALAALAGLLPPGGHLLFGDGYWRQPPWDDYLAFLGCELSDMTTFSEMQGAGERLGLVHVASRGSTHEEWDDYEGSFQASMIAWCDAHPDDADEPKFRTRITNWRDGYLQWGRETLGFGMYVWVCPS